MMQIPGYTIIRELGRGGMATVYLAKQDRLGRQVALKVMQPLATTGDDFTARFIKEGRIIAQLQHPKIVTIYDFDIADGLHYFSMEYLPNGTLSDQIQRGLSTERAVEITRGIAEALAVAHDHGVIHRDIKPQNVLFRADGTPVLTDFGIARAAGAGAEQTQVTNFGMVIGSPRYMSPEQSLSKPIDARSDLYGLGVAFYEMLTKELPYQADDVISLAMKHCSAPIPSLTGPLAKYQPIIEKLLAKQPEDRFGSAQELIRALDAFKTGETTLTGPSEEATRIVSKDKPARERVGDDPSKTPPRWSLGRLAIIAIVISAPVAIGVYFLGTTTQVDDPLESILQALPAPPPGRSATTDRYETLALEHLRAGELPQSLELVDLALGSHPGDPRLRALKVRLDDHVAADEMRKTAERELKNGAIDDSLAHIEQGLASVPDHSALIALQERALAERKRLAGEQAAELRRSAEAALDQDDLTESMRLVRDARAITPDDERLQALEAKIQQRLEREATLQVVIRQASSLIAEGLLNESLDLIEQGLVSYPNDSQLTDLKSTVTQQIASETERKVADLSDKATLLASQKRFDDALSAVDQASRLQPDNRGLKQLRQDIAAQRSAMLSDKLFDQARGANSAGKLNEALRLADEGLAIHPENVGLFVFRSMIEAKISEQETVRETTEQVRALLRKQEFDKARNTVETALKKAPNNPKLLALHGEVLSAQEDTKKKQVTELLRYAQRSLSTDNLEEALNLTRKALQLEPKSPAAINLEKQILQRQASITEVAEKISACDNLWIDEPLTPTTQQITTLVSAAACYRQVLTDDDDHNPKAIASLSAIRDHLTNTFADVLAIGDLKTGQQLIEALKTAYPSYPELGALQARLDSLAALLPEMIGLDKGCFQIGSPQSEENRESDEPQHQVCVKAFEIAKYETKAADFQRFIDSQNYETDAERGIGNVVGCWTLDLDNQTSAWGYQDWASWLRPNKYQDTRPDLPVSCVSKNDALAYIHWLNDQTGQTYRLPTEAEWEYAARAGTTDIRFWGPSDGHTACKHENVADTAHDWSNGFNCNDGYEWAAPIGSFSANPWGLYDVLGNVSEWTCSEYNSDYSGAEKKCAAEDSTAPISLRGGAWNSGPEVVRSAYRNRNYPESRYSFVGFRLARGDLADSDRTPTEKTR
jgi:serine/threonine-protein kinase PpkA